MFWITITKKIIISKTRKAHLYVALSTYTRARLSRLNVCLKERTQRRRNDLEQNTEKRKKLRGSCRYIQPESNSLGRYLVPRSTCEILSGSTCAVTARICKRRLRYRKQNGLSDHATKNLASAWICERKILLQNKNKSQ